MVRDSLKEFFRPEFLNRIDEIVIFDRLDAEQLGQIVKIQLQRVIDRLARQNIHLNVSDDVTKFVADAGFDPVFGARPLKRAIQKHLLDPLSLSVLEGNFKEGDSIDAKMAGGRVVFTKH
jgi:ATP-dependent Clp protease ATP-binding subunit ClpB